MKYYLIWLDDIALGFCNVTNEICSWIIHKHEDFQTDWPKGDRWEEW
jgi:hypothetical protein